jgi:hypothetical protein
VQARYTTLRVSEAGVVLYEEHARRLAPHGGPARLRFDRFAAGAAAGVYALLDDGAVLDVHARAGSALADGMPCRVLPSPVADQGGPFPKPAPPGPYAAVREVGVATLLASPAGGELWESCVAAIVGWDGAGVVLVPADRPRVASLAETAIGAAFPHRRAAIVAAGDAALLLANAVASCRPQVPRRAPFPERVAREIARVIEGTARRP